MSWLVLTLPPSTNNLFTNVPGKGRVKTKAYLAWIKAAGWDLHLQKPKAVAGLYRLTIRVPKDCPIDLDNFKALSDLLQKHRVIENDRQAWSFVVERRIDAEAVAHITVEACP